MPNDHPQLHPARLRKLRPTQITVGLAEVAYKQTAWDHRGKSDRRKYLSNHWFPAVLGPEGELYIVDHHHLGRALLDVGVEHCQVVLQADLSHLGPEEFWLTMEQRQWVHPYDAKGRRRDTSALPHSLEGLKDDPYRSLAGAVRRVGGFPKDTTPFAEFLWADFFRRRIPATELKHKPEQALAKAMKLSHSPEAAHLPGWSGVQTSAPETKTAEAPKTAKAPKASKPSKSAKASKPAQAAAAAPQK